MEFKIRCPFHSENTASFHINLETGKWHCFGLCSRSGSAREVEDILQDKPTVSSKTVKREAPKEPPPIPESEVDRLHSALLDDPAAMYLLNDRCGITPNTVKEFKLGWTGSRYAWPVYDTRGIVRNIRLYEYGHTGDQKVISYAMKQGGTVHRYGSSNSRLFPIRVLSKATKFVFLCEGEKDALNVNQAGYAAVSVTGGAGTWTAEYCAPPLRGKHVLVLYDIDRTGKINARKVSSFLKNIAASVTVCTLPDDIPDFPDHGDITDYLMMQPGAAVDFLQKCIEDVSNESDEGNASVLSALPDSKRPEYNNRRIRVDAHVVGKETTPYTADRGYYLACPMSRGKICDSCGLGGQNDGEQTVIIKPDSKDMLYTIERTDEQIKAFIEKKAALVKCPLWTIEPVEAARSSIEKIVLATTVDQRSYDGSSEYVQQIAYAVDTLISSNQVYKFDGRVTTHPKDQRNVFIITKANTSRLSIDNFDTLDSHDRLKFFQPTDDTPGAVQSRLEQRWSDLSNNVTGIYSRRSLHVIADLVAHSLLRFTVFGRTPDRGWLEGYIGGDTRQGKSEVAKRLHQHYRAGELVVAENASLAGILGGAQKLGNGEWMVTWGKCPLNDRGWVTFDECQNIPLSVMGALSGMRSSGVAEIDKIRIERVQARTRLLWLSNPRSDSLNVDQLAQGIQLIPDVFGRPEDVARLDIATVVRSSDLDTSVLRSRANVPHTHTTDLCHTLVMWTWSRLPSNVEFIEDTEFLCMEVADRLVKTYNSDIKIIESMEQRIKVARVAAAIAALCYSTPDGIQLYVKPAHVLTAESLLNQVFKDEAVAYHEYASAYHNAECVKNEDIIVEWFKRQNEELIRALLTQREMRLFDFQNFANTDRDRAQTLLSFLVQQRALVLRNGTYAKSPHFVVLLRQALSQKWYANGRATVQHSGTKTPTY